MTARIDDTLSYVIPPVVEKKKPSLLSRIASAICDFAKSFFKTICFWKHSSLDLGQKKIELMNKTAHPSTKKHFSKETTPDEDPKITKKVTVVKPEAEYEPKTKVGIAAKEPKVFDQSIANLRRLVKDSVDIALETIYDKKVTPFLSDVEKGIKNIPELLKLFSSLVIDVGDDSLQPIMQLFAKSTHHELDPASKHLLQWLKNAKNQEELRSKIESDLKEEFGKQAFPSSQSLSTYSQPILDWLFKSDYSAKINDLFPADHFDQKLALTIFKSTLKLLTKNKIDNYDKLFLNSLQNNLPEIIKSGLITNSEKVADTLFILMAELVESMQWPQTFDNLFSALNDQVSSYLFAQQLMDQLNEQLKNPQNPATAGTLADVKNCSAALKEALAKLTKDDKEALLKLKNTIVDSEKKGEDKKTLEKYKNLYFLKAFATQKCDLKIKKSIDALDIKDDDALLEQINKKILADKSRAAADSVLSLLLTDDNAMDLSGGIEDIWNIIKLHPKFTELVSYAKEIVKDIAVYDLNNDLEKIEDSLRSMIKDFCIGFLEDQIKDMMRSTVETIFQKLITPSFIEDGIAEYILPALNPELMLVFSKMVMENNVKKLRPLFEALIKQPEKRENNLAIIRETLLKMAVETGSEFKKSISTSIIEKYHSELAPRFDALFKPIAGDNSNAIEKTADLMLEYAANEHPSFHDAYSIKSVFSEQYKIVGPMLELLITENDQNTAIIEKQLSEFLLKLTFEKFPEFDKHYHALAEEEKSQIKAELKANFAEISKILKKPATQKKIEKSLEKKKITDPENLNAQSALSDIKYDKIIRIVNAKAPDFKKCNMAILITYFKKPLAVHAAELEHHLKKKEVQIKITEEMKKPENKGKDSLVLVRTAMEGFSGFTALNNAVSITSFKELIDPLILDVEKELKTKDPQCKDIPGIITAFVNKPNGENTQSIYGELALNVLFEVGKFDAGIAEGFIKGKKNELSKTIGDLLYKTRKSHEFVIDKLVQKGKKTKHQIPQLIEAALKKDKKPDTSNDYNAKFNSEVNKTAGIAHDLLCQVADNKAGWFGTTAAQYVVGKNSSSLSKVIKVCFEKLLGKQMLNANLMFRIQDVMLDSLLSAYKTNQLKHETQISVEDLTV